MDHITENLVGQDRPVVLSHIRIVDGTRAAPRFRQMNALVYRWRALMHPIGCKSYDSAMQPGERTALEMGECSLAVGQHSVGLPLSRTSEQVVEAYLELITLVRDGRPEHLRSEDIDTLVRETRLERVFIENRVASHLATL